MSSIAIVGPTIVTNHEFTYNHAVEFRGVVMRTRDLIFWHTNSYRRGSTSVIMDRILFEGCFSQVLYTTVWH